MLINNEVNIIDNLVHDLISPLEVFKTILKKTIIDAEEILVLNNVVDRFEDIISSVVEKSERQINIRSIDKKINDLVNEKNFLVKKIIDIKYTNSSAVLNDLNIDKFGLIRCIDNLMNNSLEAAKPNGVITINVWDNCNYCNIDIIDNGHGMTKKNCKKLNNLINLDQKDGGNGIGFKFVKRYMKVNRGKIEINSLLNQTRIRLKFKKDNTINDCYDYVLIDDDELQRMLWQIESKRKNIKVCCISSYDELLNLVDKISFVRTKIYVDYHLKNNIKGDDIVSYLTSMGFEQVFLYTAYPLSKFSDSSIKNINLKCIPF